MSPEPQHAKDAAEARDLDRAYHQLNQYLLLVWILIILVAVLLAVIGVSAILPIVFVVLGTLWLYLWRRWANGQRRQRLAAYLDPVTGELNRNV
ncbi:MAG TPA: hypothetical protein VGI67_13575 [Thermoleophilaceae bacterium]|jgi:Flp pilus assembly protein TadB